MTRRLSLTWFALLTMGCGASRERAAPAAEGAVPELDARAAAVIDFAQAQVGKRYCWGGTGPSCFDCSGLVQTAWSVGGVRLPRTSEDQGRAVSEVPLRDVRPGDILWWPHHVGLYVGGGAMVDAYHSGAGVVRRPAAVPVRVLRPTAAPRASASTARASSSVALRR